MNVLNSHNILEEIRQALMGLNIYTSIKLYIENREFGPCFHITANYTEMRLYLMNNKICSDVTTEYGVDKFREANKLSKGQIKELFQNLVPILTKITPELKSFSSTVSCFSESISYLEIGKMLIEVLKDFKLKTKIAVSINSHLDSYSLFLTIHDSLKIRSEAMGAAATYGRAGKNDFLMLYDIKETEINTLVENINKFKAELDTRGCQILHENDILYLDLVNHSVSIGSRL